ncbi:MAG: 16S rRNA (guanine(527)-N(7))-methyltransferase RsmG [Meiothermus sp.]|uniref:16S rRNA (guanine(527)-N(7))-methyltransferase RsmG n=1 Tax=Meiothermus sp. TaxID=1955249 RepID=UPI0025E46410|nr:16S rRNA (guanine(527)-N(7))-methyltransferase RsmG [Meiothermus sp.]MCS7068569.1 16S rRNA (guanine(527)-N(7))-methyltransferase RsmG [Meiothermus sp.]MDW8424847.1 16S rRNA (guanine(527)-N(7))-methyltransferase RsmG [Meiothermus sp.]
MPTSALSEQGKSLLLRAAREIEVDLEPTLPRFEQFYRRLVEANATTNLTAIRDERGIVLKHFVDSLSCLKSGRLEGSLRVLDLGTGAGFPGLPLKLVRPELELTFLDATHKKIAFIESICRELNLSGTQCLWGRAETLGHDPAHREAYDRVVSRAVSALNTLSELCLPLVKVGGFMIAQKGAGVAEELEQARAAIHQLGGAVRDVVAFKLLGLEEPRALVVVEKTHPTPARYPRRAGVPAKNPLS